MRRTATLSIFAEENENNLANIDNLFAINKKCILELGIVNNVHQFTYNQRDENQNLNQININYQDLYGDIIWFPLGVYIMFNPSVSHSMQGVTISMNLKDKMCLLNGDLGGEIHSSVTFSSQDQLVDADTTTLEKNPVLIYNIIKQLVNHWGNEKLDNIVISQVPLMIKQVVRWKGTKNIYLNHIGNNQYIISQSPENEFREFEPGMDIGFIYTDFVYPGQLVCNAGQTVTSVLDKIINIIGNYEYFYDVFGKFRFQEKQNYLNMTNTAYWAKEQDNKVGNLPSDVYQADYYRLTKSVYDFTDNNYTVTYNNSLNYNNIKNDFVVWGLRKSTNNVTYGCRFHLAIDKKPTLNEHTICLYQDSYHTVRAVHWHDETEGVAAGPTVGTYLFPQAESDLAKGQVIAGPITRTSVDWREEIYYQMLEDQYRGTGQNTERNNSYFQYYAELKEEFPKIFDLQNQTYKVDIKMHPEEMNYFLDFIDQASQLGQYSINNIGRRAKILDSGEEGINCVFEPQIPDMVYVNANMYTEEKYLYMMNMLKNYGQNYTQVQNSIYNLLEIGGVFNSCFERIKDLLYQYTHVNNTISLTTLPIYYLQPNTRITIEDKSSGIYGDYIIQSISLPLDINSTMNINAYKALQKI